MLKIPEGLIFLFFFFRLNILIRILKLIFHCTISHCNELFSVLWNQNVYFQLGSVSNHILLVRCSD